MHNTFVDAADKGKRRKGPSQRDLWNFGGDPRTAPPKKVTLQKEKKEPMRSQAESIPIFARMTVRNMAACTTAPIAFASSRLNDLLGSERSKNPRISSVKPR